MRLLELSLLLLVTSPWTVFAASPNSDHFGNLEEWVLRNDGTLKDLKKTNDTATLKKNSSGSKKSPRDFTFKDILEEMEQEAQERLEEVIEQLGSPLNEMRDYLEERAHQASQGSPREDPPPTIPGLGMYLPLTAPFLSECQKILTKMSFTEQLWPIIMEDSWGKIPDGLLNGNVQVLGMSEECVSINADDETHILGQTIRYHIEGKYCLVTISHPVILQRSNLGVEVFPRRQPLFFSIPEDPEERMAMGASMILPFYSYGTCMPAACTQKMLEESVAQTLDNDTYNIRVDCQVHPDKPEMQPKYNAGDIVFVVVMGIIGTLVVLAGVIDVLLDYFRREEAKKGPLKYLLVFSFYTNLSKMFHLDFHNKNKNITCLHGIRVMSMAWIIYAHEYMVLSMRAKNLFALNKLTDNFLDQTITNGTVSVDSFFFMSGLLVAYSILREMNRTKKFNFILFYVHRVIRLVPPILMAAAFLATVARFLLVGPFAPRFERDVTQMCRDGWWYDALFISNLMFAFSDKASCIGQSWYVGVDTQLYIFAPFIILPIFYRRNLGLAWLGFITIVSLVVPGVIIGVNNLPPTMIFGPLFSQEAGMDYQKLVYFTPWCRASAYLAGFWAGVLIFYASLKKVVLNRWLVLAGWLTAATLALLVLYGMAPYNVFVDPAPMPEGMNVAYGALHRFVWCLALLWVVFACYTGYGGPVDWFLSHPGFQPLSKLTYTMYLLSIPLQEMQAYSVFETIHLDHTYAVTTTCGVLFLVGLASIVLSLATEGPVLGLERLLLRRPGRGPSEVRENGLPTTVTPEQEQANGDIGAITEVPEVPEVFKSPETTPEDESSAPEDPEPDLPETQDKTSAVVHVNEGFVGDGEKISKF